MVQVQLFQNVSSGNATRSGSSISFSIVAGVRHYARCKTLGFNQSLGSQALSTLAVQKQPARVYPCYLRRFDAMLEVSVREKRTLRSVHNKTCEQVRV